VAGACIGSFLATVARRWESGPFAALHGRSACDSCHTTLGPIELVPILGRIFLRGRCRHCGSPIPLTETWIEMGGALAGVVALAIVPGSAPWVMAAGWLLVLLAAIDWFHGILPDVLNAVLLLLGLLAVFADPGAPSALDALAGGVLGAGAFALIALVYQAVRGRSGLGGGDVKLMGALGIWVGAAGLAWIVLLAAASALIGTLIVARGRLDGAQAIRFGPWLAAAGFAVMVAGRY
jgi:leader peptidase (prepilin peptidase)/N-methyltransferase